MIKTEISNQPISLSQIASWQPHSSHGASNMFCGFVRDINMGKQVVAVEYDCFAPLAEKVFREIAEEAKTKWGQDTQIWIRHAYGRLQVGHVSVLIFVTTRHRDESYRASRYIIEQIKTRAPIWKKEFYHDGETDWVRGHALCQHHHHEDDGHAHGAHT